MNNDVLMTKIPRLVAFLTGEIQSRDDKRAKWAQVKRERNEELCELLGVNPAWGIQAGNLLGFDIDPERKLVLLNYSSTAHNLLHEIEDGWTSELRMLRGVVFTYQEPGQLEGVELVSRGFEKFFNQSELPETSMVSLAALSGGRKMRCTRKEDGHMIEFFLHNGELCTTTRGKLGTPSAVTALTMLSRAAFIKAATVANSLDFDLMTLVCELVHPNTEVHVDYEGDEKLFLLEAYDKDGRSISPIIRRQLCKVVRDLHDVDETWMTLEELSAEVNDRSVVNREGWVAQVPSLEGGTCRVKFKYISYIGRMVESKLSYKYVMNCMKSDRLDKMLITLPEEIREVAYRMVSEVKTTLATVCHDTGSYKPLYDFYTPLEGGVENFRNVCRCYYRSQLSA